VLSLACVSTGIPEPTITFFHNSIEIKSDLRISQQGYFLIITNVVESDSGEYYCRAENVAGTVQSPSARLIIFGKLKSVYSYYSEAEPR